MYEKLLNNSVIAKRLHHQLFPMTILHEKGFNAVSIYFPTKYIDEK